MADRSKSPARPADGEPPRRVAVLGSSGSIGRNTIEVIRASGGRLKATVLSAHTRLDQLIEQAELLKPKFVVASDEQAAAEQSWKKLPKGTELLVGAKGLEQAASCDEVDVVLAAIVGAAGVRSTLAALKAGKTVALANKETLVTAGPLVRQMLDAERAKNPDAPERLLPVDSEHSAVFQSMACGRRSEVERIVLTASGGPFRGKTASDLEDVTPEQALCHPTWQMGPKITIDSATLMNKSLEVIEARWLFDLTVDQLDVIVHPESMVHSFVEFADGSVLAQLSPPDMRLPIQYALTYPERLPGPAKKLDWRALRTLRFERPDRETFAALDLGFEVVRRGGTCGAVLNGANEAAVAKFLAKEIGFLDVARSVRAVLDAHDFDPSPTLDGLLAADRWARQEVGRWTRTRPQATRS